MRAGSKTVMSLMAASAIIAGVCLAPPLEAQRGQDGAAPPAGQRGAGAGGQRGGRGAPQTPAGPTPRLPNGKPDLSGLWANPYTPNMAADAAPRSIPRRASR